MCVSSLLVFRCINCTALGYAPSKSSIHTVSRKNQSVWYQSHIAVVFGTLIQGHTAVTIGTEMVVFGGIVNGERVNEVKIDRLTTTGAAYRVSIAIGFRVDPVVLSSSGDETLQPTVQPPTHPISVSSFLSKLLSS